VLKQYADKVNEAKAMFEKAVGRGTIAVIRVNTGESTIACSALKIENQEAFKLLDSPLWSSVPAFKNNKVYKFERSHWQSGAITANMKKLDDLIAALSEK